MSLSLQLPTDGTDCWELLQAIVDYQTETVLPAGTYMLGSTLRLEGAKVLRGVHRDAVRLVTPGQTGHDAVRVIGEGARLSDLTIRCGDDAGSPNHYSLYIVNASHVVVERVRLLGSAPSTGTSIVGPCRVISCQHTTFRDCEFAEGTKSTSTTAWGCEIGSAEHLLLDNCWAHHNVNDGLKIRYPSKYVTVRGGVYSDNGDDTLPADGIDLKDGGYRVTIDGVVCELNRGNGITYKGAGPHFLQLSNVRCNGNGSNGFNGQQSPCREVTIIGGEFSENGDNGLQLYGDGGSVIGAVAIGNKYGVMIRGANYRIDSVRAEGNSSCNIYAKGTNTRLSQCLGIGKGPIGNIVIEQGLGIEESGNVEID